ncbi:10545_t:CDS:2 [Funneliformis mosseae]|uniref:10545_t:CDS:1 n=1 Tax=Funneliformis mosseae TaxID=27381 RepID=A0A9N9I164_FUNMO|nr:10545_t:CDS:2 [Funneliformis mosseae]
MVKTRELKPEEKGGIVALLNNNFINAQITKRIKIPDSIVPTKRKNRLLIREVMRNRRAPLRELTSNVGFNVSTTTASNYLHEAVIKSHVAAKKPFISDENRK